MFGRDPRFPPRVAAGSRFSTRHKKVQRDETGELEIAVSLDAEGNTRVTFGKPITYLALTADKAYDFAHLILEQVKDKQGGEPVNVTEDKIVAALEHALAKHGVGVKMEMPPRDLAIVLTMDFMAHMAGETDV